MSATGPSAIVLAGGRGSRMGAPKAALMFGNLTLLERVVAELRKSFPEVIVAAAPEGQGDAALHDARGVKIIRDAVAFQGPLFALQHALEAAASDPVFVCSCDLPMLDASVASALVAVIADHDAVIPEVGGKPQPLCAVYRKRCADAIATLLARGERRLTALAAEINVRTVEENALRAIDPELRSFFNLNTPEDYATALRMAGITG
ncbi:MAG: molybdenum cofactor guanylyltransferase [Candidatus Binataceae bacterium]